ncbi:MAG: hypothetical protein ACRCTD_05105 [Beijerinckiaceae bacterium]
MRDKIVFSGSMALMALLLSGCVASDPDAERKKASLIALPPPENFDPKKVDPKLKRRVYEEYTVAIDAAQRCSNRRASEIILEDTKKEKRIDIVLGSAYDSCPEDWEKVARARLERQKVDGTTAYPLEGMILILRSNYIEQFTPYYTNKKIEMVPGPRQNPDSMPAVEE